MRPGFITFDGIDGSGKSTHIETAVKWFADRALPCQYSREPGGTELGERIRDLLLEVNRDPSMDMNPVTETLLMFAARSEHVRKVVVPSLEAGKWVILDRFTDATYAYQCGGRGVDPVLVERLETAVQGDLRPDLTFIFDIPVNISVGRIERSRDKDRFELEGAEFFEKVRQGYLDRARRYPDRYVVLDTSRDIEVVAAELSDRLELLARRLEEN